MEIALLYIPEVIERWRFNPVFLFLCFPARDSDQAAAGAALPAVHAAGLPAAAPSPAAAVPAATGHGHLQDGAPW